MKQREAKTYGVQENKFNSLQESQSPFPASGPWPTPSVSHTNRDTAAATSAAAAAATSTTLCSLNHTFIIYVTI